MSSAESNERDLLKLGSSVLQISSLCDIIAISNLSYRIYKSVLSTSSINWDQKYSFKILLCYNDSIFNYTVLFNFAAVFKVSWKSLFLGKCEVNYI